MWLGLYPHWILLLSAAAMLIVCFVISWWVESRWVIRYMRKTRGRVEIDCSRVARNANLLSYAFLSVAVFFVLVSLWPESINRVVGP